jgi:hypothetical protein
VLGSAALLKTSAEVKRQLDAYKDIEGHYGWKSIPSDLIWAGGSIYRSIQSLCNRLAKQAGSGWPVSPGGEKAQNFLSPDYRSLRPLTTPSRTEDDLDETARFDIVLTSKCLPQ